MVKELYDLKLKNGYTFNIHCNTKLRITVLNKQYLYPKGL